MAEPSDQGPPDAAINGQGLADLPSNQGGTAPDSRSVAQQISDWFAGQITNHPFGSLAAPLSMLGVPVIGPMFSAIDAIPKAMRAAAEALGLAPGAFDGDFSDTSMQQDGRPDPLSNQSSTATNTKPIDAIMKPDDTTASHPQVSAPNTANNAIDIGGTTKKPAPLGAAASVGTAAQSQMSPRLGESVIMQQLRQRRAEATPEFASHIGTDFTDVGRRAAESNINSQLNTTAQQLRGFAASSDPSMRPQGTIDPGSYMLAAGRAQGVQNTHNPIMDAMIQQRANTGAF